MPLSKDAIADILGRWPVARLATLAESGFPHVVPIVFVHLDERIWSPLDGKPKRGAELKRIRNIEREARCSLLLDHYDEDWRRLWWLRVDGRAEVVRGDALPSEVLAAALREKYPQYAQTPVFLGEPTALSIEIDRFASWTAR